MLLLYHIFYHCCGGRANLHEIVTLQFHVALLLCVLETGRFFFVLQVLSGDVGEDAEVHAAKLMEVILLQCSGKVDHVSKPFSEGWGALMIQYHGDDY